MLWDEQCSVSSGLGYKDNVLLSALNPQGSAYSLNSVDLMAYRMPLDGWEIVASLMGDDTRYWHNVGTDREDLFTGSLRVARKFSSGWEFGLEGRGLYENQVLDVSTDTGTPTTTLVEGFSLTAQPWVRRDLWQGLWIKMELPFTQWILASPMDNYQDYGPVAAIGWDAGKRADVVFSYAVAYQPHESWMGTDVNGNVLPGTPLEMYQEKTELAWHQYWDQDRHWRSGTRLAAVWKKDNASGYFNYFEYHFAQDLRWQTRDWMVRASAQWSNDDYPIQTIHTHFPDLLYRTLWSLSLEVERRLFKSLKGYAKYEYQAADSNQWGNAGTYHANNYLLGLKLEF